jgi:hypothetical protein
MASLGCCTVEELPEVISGLAAAGAGWFGASHLGLST